jgi:hypothetical protein
MQLLGNVQLLNMQSICVGCYKLWITASQHEACVCGELVQLATVYCEGWLADHDQFPGLTCALALQLESLYYVVSVYLY